MLYVLSELIFFFVVTCFQWILYLLLHAFNDFFSSCFQWILALLLNAFNELCHWRYITAMSLCGYIIPVILSLLLHYCNVSFFVCLYYSNDSVFVAILMFLSLVGYTIPVILSLLLRWYQRLCWSPQAVKSDTYYPTSVKIKDKKMTQTFMDLLCPLFRINFHTEKILTDTGEMLGLIIQLWAISQSDTMPCGVGDHYTPQFHVFWTIRIQAA